MVVEVSKLTGIPVELILGRSRDPKVSCVRQLYWKLLRDEKHYTFRRIAELNERETSSIQLGVKRANNLLDTGDSMAYEFWNKIKAIER